MSASKETNVLESSKLRIAGLLNILKVLPLRQNVLDLIVLHFFHGLVVQPLGESDATVSYASSAMAVRGRETCEITKFRGSFLR